MTMSKILNFDRLGIFISVLCVTHCLITPFLIITMPWLGDAFEDPRTHLIFLLFVLPIAWISFYHTYRAHKDFLPIRLGLIGSVLLVLGIIIPMILGGEFLHHDHDQIDLVNELIGHGPSIFGSLFIISAHRLNIKRCFCHSRSSSATHQH